MALVTGTVQDLGYDGMDGTLWARPARFRSDGQVVYAPERKPYKIEAGLVSADLAPGPAVLELQVGSHARDTFEVVIPDQDSILLADLLDSVFPWEPAQVSLFVAEREAAEQAKSDAVTAAGAAETAAGTATTAAQQTGQDRTHVDQVRTELEEAYDESQAGQALPPRLTETALNATYAGRDRTVAVFLPEAFGAVGDGTTDDTAAVQSAIDAARDAGGGIVFFQSGKTYKVVALSVGAGCTLDGHGATLLRPDMTPNGTHMISNAGRQYTGQATDSIRPIVLRGLTLDGNLVNQGPYNNYEQEQSSLILFSVMAGSLGGREKVIIEDVTVMGSVSDGVHIVRNIDATIRNLTAIDCFRGGLTCTGGNSKVHLNKYRGGGDIVGAHIDVEVDSMGYGGSGFLDFIGTDIIESTKAEKPSQIGTGDWSRFHLKNCRFRSGLYVLGGKSGKGSTIRFEDCEFDTFDETYKRDINAPYDVKFIRCKFRAHAPASKPAVGRALHVTHQFGGWAGSTNLRFEDCEWEVGDVSGATGPRAINSDQTVLTGAKVTLWGGRIAAGFERGLVIASGTGTLGGRLRYEGTGFVVEGATAAAGDRPYHIVLGEIDFTDPTPGARIRFYNSHANCSVTRLGGTIRSVHANLSTTLGIGDNQYRGTRTILVAAPPTGGGLVGDIAQREPPVAGQPFQWVCTASHPTAATWKALTTAAA